MSILATAFLAIAAVFLAIGIIMIFRLKEAKGSLRLAKISVVMAVFSATTAFLIDCLQQFIFVPFPMNNPSWLLVKQLYVPLNFFAMLVLAFLASFAIFATYSGRGRKVIVALFFIVALMPTAYLTFAYNEALLAPAEPGDPEAYLLTVTPLTHVLFALCAIPLGVVPLAAFGRSYAIAKQRGEKSLSRGAVMMFLAVLLNEVAYLLFGFTYGFMELVTIIAWIPIAFFLLFAVLRITASAEPKV